MRQNDKQNLIRGLPVYALCVLMIIGISILYIKQPPEKGEPLRKTLARYFENGTQQDFDSLDAVINDRTTWQPQLPESVGQQIEDFEFSDLDGKSYRLTDFAGGPVVFVQWATWSPGCTMQFGHWQELRRRNPGLIIVAFSSESKDTLERYAQQQNQGTLMLVPQEQPLPNPLSEVADIPSAFFIDRQGRLFLAARGLIPFEHADAILEFMEPKPVEKEQP
jgi:peroxiredoxin